MRSLLLALPLLALTACVGGSDSKDPVVEKDSDGDGLSDAAEADFGSDPNNVDTDGDGLDDFEEEAHGSDPNSADSDGDGYEDAWEVYEGSDPADEGSVIYKGGWPYNPDKDALGDVSWADAVPEKDAQVPRVVYLDQHGDMVDLYDFAGHGKPIVIDISATWCPPCQGVASWISGEGDPYGFGNSWPNVPAAVENGDVYWITVMGQKDDGGLPKQKTLEDWAAEYPDEHIPVLGDDGEFAPTYVVSGWPTIFILNDDMTVMRDSFENYTVALKKVDNLYSGE
ncbi:MAG: hypothetical protein GY913_02685 [Proteobacteria bacterium]|nr:hypothetical protein [Pseudomonadota bacterium]MCP4915804.1 hypothetical protein [Pseudomonadota bacterium]